MAGPADPQGRGRRDQACRSAGRHFPRVGAAAVEEVARRGSTPLVVADGTSVLGVVELKDIVKGGIKERFAELRRWASRR
jgi:K+-transporting ATPase ATPase B chain